MQEVLGQDLDAFVKAYDDLVKSALETNQALADDNKTIKKSDVKYSPRDFGLEDFNKDSLNNIKMRGGIIIENETELNSHITKALTSNKKENLYLGAISENTKAKIEQELGIAIFKKLGQYTYSISYDDIRHISKHYSTNAEIINTVKVLFGMLNNYDNISNETLKDGQNRIILEKSLPNADYLTVNIVSSKRRSLDLTTIYITKKNKNGAQLNQPDISNSKDVAQLESNSAINSISSKTKISQEKFSDRDTAYMDAVNRGDMETAQRLVDEEAKKAGYSEKLYHQTGNNFFEFDTRHKGAGTRDNETPFGIFMKKTDADIGIKGQKQMPLFAKINNPLKVNNRASLVYELKKISPKYQEIKEKLNNLDKEYQERFDNAKNEWREWLKEWRRKNPNAERREAYNDPEFEEVFSQEEKVVDEWTEIATELDTQAKEIITTVLKEKGYDGIILLEDKGSFGRSTEAYIALEPTQVKSADAVTYN